MSENTANLKSEVNMARDRLGRDVDAIENRIDDNVHRIRSSWQVRTIDSVYSRVKQDPLGYLLVGAGILRLFRSNSWRGESGMSRYPAFSDRARDKWSETERKGEDLLERTKDSAQHLKERFQHGVDEVGNQGKDLYYRTKESAFAHPIVFAGVGLALGAIAAAIIPGSEKEKETVGPIAEKVKDQVLGGAKDQVQKLKQSMG